MLTLRNCSRCNRLRQANKSPIQIKKLGHVVFYVSDVERSTRFYTDVLNFRVSDVNENGMVFFTACGDHHTIAIAPATAGAEAKQPEKGQLGMSHFAMEVGSLEELNTVMKNLGRVRGVMRVTRVRT